MTLPDLAPLPEGTLDKLRQVSTSTIATQLYKRGYRQPQMMGVKPLSQVADGFVAEAFTMRFIPAREDVDTLDPYASGNTLQWDSIELAPAGSVIVVDSRGDASAASGGDMLMTRAWKRGVAGFVTDGGLRDGHVLSQLPFPTYASQVTITTRAAFHHVADLQVPIGCGGVAVYPGDVLVADRDGIIVVPRAWAGELADPSLAQEKLEAYVSIKIHAGELAGNYRPATRFGPRWPQRRPDLTTPDRTLLPGPSCFPSNTPLCHYKLLTMDGFIWQAGSRSPAQLRATDAENEETT